MKETSLVHMPVPTEAYPISAINEKGLGHDNEPEDLWLLGSTTSTLGILAVIPVTIINPAIWVPAITGVPLMLIAIVTFLTSFGSLIAIFHDKSVLTYGGKTLRKVAKPIDSHHWRSETKTSLGMLIHQVHVSTMAKAFFNPVRFFKKIPLAIHIYYNPENDVYSRITYYAKGFEYGRTMEKFGGARYSFKKSLETLKGKK